MKTEYSNYNPTREPRAIPKSCPAELRAKIEATREKRTVVKTVEPVVVSAEQDAATLKEFVSQIVEQ